MSTSCLFPHFCQIMSQEKKNEVLDINVCRYFESSVKKDYDNTGKIEVSSDFLNMISK